MEHEPENEIDTGVIEWFVYIYICIYNLYQYIYIYISIVLQVAAEEFMQRAKWGYASRVEAEALGN